MLGGRYDVVSPVETVWPPTTIAHSWVSDTRNAQTGHHDMIARDIARAGVERRTGERACAAQSGIDVRAAHVIQRVHGPEVVAVQLDHFITRCAKRCSAEDQAHGR